MECQCSEGLLVTSSVDGANVRDALKLISFLNQALTNPAQSYEMMIFTSDTKRFLTFLQRLFVRYVLNGFSMTRYSSGAWNRG